jgi:iron complex outermembrane receptor protein
MVTDCARLMRVASWIAASRLAFCAGGSFAPCRHVWAAAVAAPHVRSSIGTTSLNTVSLLRTLDALRRPLACVALCMCVPKLIHAQAVGIILVTVMSADGVIVENAEVRAGAVVATTGPDGTASLSVPAGRVDVVVTRQGYDAAAAPVDVRSGEQTRVAVELQPQSEIEETIIVSATRSERRIEDEPLRVEVVPEEEVQEKIAMTPGDVSMLLAETNGLRVQATAPSIGGASVRIQGLNGRYTQILSDGLPLYGGQSGAVGILQIPPIDLAQVEVIKGVASALYGMSAIGGVVNLVSRRPRVDAPEREILLNATSHRGIDGALWLARALDERWGVSVLAGVHTQDRSDLDADGWTDLPFYRRGQGRARIMWDNGGGRSLLLTAGGMTEHRRGGTMPGAVTPDGNAYAENLDTTRVDGGLIGRFLTAGGRVLAIRASGMTQLRDRTFGTLERDRSSTWFGESSVTGTSGRHTWVAGAALQRDTFDSPTVPRFNFAYTTPGIFAQDEYAVTPRVTVSGSGRADVHSEFGAFFSPRVSALLRPGGPVTVRLSAGRGHLAPVPFTDETDAIGLTSVAPPGELEPEHASTLSGDITWTRSPIEITATVFQSRIDNAVMFSDQSGPYVGRLVNASRPTRTRGTEFIARHHQENLDLIVTQMYVWSTEAADDGGTREVPLNPRHSAAVDLLWRFGNSQLGVEAFYTGTQRLELNPHRERGSPYLLFGGLLMHRIGRAQLYVNSENLADVRQTKTERLLLAQRAKDGRWSTDAWAPLEGRTINAGLRLRF